MKTETFKFSRKATTALLLCTGLVASQPLSLWAENDSGAVQIVQQQKITVKGTVNDAMGPVIGASVVEKGNSSNGTITDMDGNFSLSVQPGTVLVVSYIGYKTQEVTATVGKAINVTLQEDNEMLDEVVVVGFGTQKKVNLTGSVGIATAKEIESRPVTSAVQALQGLVPGLKISTSTGELDKNMSISVRGTGTVGSYSSGSPLILIDGTEGDLNTINPQDIENISVLKDAAASSIYGSRAPFGVILVTTKSGKAGKTSVNYNNSFRIGSPINMPESMDSYSFAVMFNEAYKNQKGSGQVFTDEVMQKMLDFQAGKLTGGMDSDPANPNAWNYPWYNAYANVDIYSEMFKSSVFSQEHNVSVNGGSEKVTYYASFNYLDQGGLLEYGEDGLSRYNVAAKINANITKWLKFNYSTRFTRNDVWRPTSFNSQFYDYFGRMTWPNMPMYDPNGYPYGEVRNIAEGGQRDVQTDRHYHQATLIIEPIKNWVTNIELNYRITDGGVKETTLPAYNHLPDGSVDDTKANSSLYQEDTKENYLNFNAYTSYLHTFNDTHNLKVMLGFQSEETKYDFSSTKKYGLMVNGLPQFDLTTGLDGTGNKKDTEVSGYHNEWATVGFFGRLNYDYKGRYLAEVNMRYDGTSRFRRGSRWQLSPSFSLGWNIAQEEFWKPIENIANLLKVRFSYGELGNQNINNWYPTYRTISIGSLNGDWLQNGLSPNTSSVGGLINTALTWEKVRTWDVGVDYGLFNNRLTGSFDYFVRFTEGMVGPSAELPATLGISTPSSNNSDLRTKGWEVSIGWKDRLKNGLGYGINLSLSDQITMIDSYPDNKTLSIDSYLPGYKDGLIWGYETIGIAKSDEEMQAHLASLPKGGQDAVGSQWAAGDIMYKDLNGDGKISEGARTLGDHGDLKILGDTYSHYFFGIDLNADWKGFDFRAFFQGVLKHDYWGSGNFTGMLFGVRGGYSRWHTRGFKQHEDYFRAEPAGLEGHELPANLDSYYPRPIFSDSSDGTSFGAKNQKVQSRYVQDASYIRLKNLQFGYTLPAKFTNKFGINRLRIFVSGENVWTGTGLTKLFDPETISGGNGGNAYPLSRTWSFGLSFTL